MAGVLRQGRLSAVEHSPWRAGAFVVGLLATGIAGCVPDTVSQFAKPSVSASDATLAYAATHSVDQPIATQPSSITRFFSNVGPDGQTDMSSWAPAPRKSETTSATATTAEATSMTPTASASPGEAPASFAPTRQAEASDEKPSALTRFLQGASSNILPTEPTEAPASMQQSAPAQAVSIVPDPTPPSRGPAEYIR